MKIRVLDSWPILEWIRHRQPATRILNQVFAESQAGTTRLLMSAVNVGEVYYFVRKYDGAALADRWRNLSGALPLTIEVPTLDEIWAAALLKGQYPIAYADAFAAALAQKYNCALLTGDPEFRTVPGLELDWIERVTN